MNYNDIYQHTLIEKLTDHQIVKGVEDLHALYTQKRSDLASTQLTELMVSSYTLFYMTTNMPKLNYLLNQLSEAVVSDFLQLPLIDFGTGPGTYLWALLAKGRVGATWGIDRSSMMLNQAEKLRSNLFPQHQISWSEQLPQNFPEGGVILFGNSINEIGAEKTVQIISRLRPKIVAFIEPGTSSFSLEMHKLRTHFSQSHYQALFPCLNLLSDCPMAIRNDESWCHQILRTTHPPEVERLSQLLKLDRKILPMTAHVYSIGKSHMIQSKATMVRFVTETKHSFEWEVCLEQAQKLNLKIFEIPKKNLSKEKIKELQRASTGHLFNYSLVKEIDSQKWRILLV